MNPIMNMLGMGNAVPPQIMQLAQFANKTTKELQAKSPFTRTLLRGKLVER